MAVTTPVTPADSGDGDQLVETALRRAGLTISGAILVGGALASWILARVIGGRAVYLMAYTGALVLVVAVVIARRKRSLTAVRSELPSRAREGQTLEVELTLTAPTRLSTFVLEEKLHPHLGATVRIPVEEVTSGEGVKFNYSFRPRLRGVYKIGPASAEWTDPFGLARRNQQLLGEAEIIVHPSTENVLDRPLTRQWEDPPLRPPISKPWPTGFEFYGMRDYVPGDDLRRVVWKAVARTGRILVKESEQGITDRIVVVLDTDREWHSPGEPSETFEFAIRVAASIGAYHIKEGFSVTLETNEAELAKALRGPQARIKYLDQLAMVKRGTLPLQIGIERILNRSRSDAHTVVVTTHLDDKSASRLGLLIDKGASVLVVVVAWDEGDLVSARRAREVGCQVVEIKPGASMRTLFAHAVGAGISRG